MKRLAAAALALSLVAAPAFAASAAVDPRIASRARPMSQLAHSTVILNVERTTFACFGGSG